MYLQRLVADKEIGFNYDYMGSAEFEFGATIRSREALARLHLKGELTCKKVRLFEKWGRSVRGPIEVFVFGPAEYISTLGITPPVDSVTADLVVTPQKEAARIDDDCYLGWMSVRTDESVLIIRADKENLERGQRFLQAFMDQIEEAEKENYKNENEPSPAFMNGWADASALNRRINPYPAKSKEAKDYDYGYAMSMEENG